MSSQINLNLKVMIIESDFYSLHALSSYFAWDRRTRVVASCQTLKQAHDYIHSVAFAEQPDIIILEAELFSTPEALGKAIGEFHGLVEDVAVMCLTRHTDPVWVEKAAEAAAKGYFLRNDVRLHLVSAICYALDHQFVVTAGLQHAAKAPHNNWLENATVLPGEREYPEMTDRIRQALWLCVIEGIPANLAADEMGISPHTIRSYIKEGYRILEAHDDTDYPIEMGPLERAFMRFTALDEEKVKGDQDEGGDEESKK